MKYYVGVGQFKVIQFNPDKEWLAGIGVKTSKDPNYLGEHKGFKTTKIVVALQNIEYNFVTFCTFPLREEIVKSKAGKFCFLNTRGMSSWSESEEELLSSFVAKSDDIFQAYDGELVLYDFLRVWLNKSEDQLNFNRGKWFKGDFSELNRRLRDSEAGLVGGSVTLELNQTKLMMKVYNKKFIPAEEVVNFQGKVFGDTYLSELRKQDRINKDKELTAAHKKYFKDWEKLLLSMNDMFYPCQDFYFNGGIKPYVAAENLILTDELVIK